MVELFKHLLAVLCVAIGCVLFVTEGLISILCALIAWDKELIYTADNEREPSSYIMIHSVVDKIYSK